METFEVRNLTFTYPDKDTPALEGVSFTIGMGEFAVVCGQSGSGKSTLLRNLKPVIAPHGEKNGEILFYGKSLEKLEQKEQASRIGYVMQNPDNQVVTDKVWHELAFGLESLGLDTGTIRLRVAEMASFFGIQEWFHKDVNNLSGGQKQILNLASVMAMQPDVLILDEPASQLDPIAAGEFLEAVKKINRELGTTVIITEHRLEEVLAMADRTIVLDSGRIIADGTPSETGTILAQMEHPMFVAMPAPIRAYAWMYKDGIGRQLQCPLNIREGRSWLTELLDERNLRVTALPYENKGTYDEEPVMEMKEVWFRYNREDEDVIKDLSFKVYPGELYCIAGGNGTGKTTTINLAGGISKPYRGTVKIKGKNIDKYRRNELFGGIIGILPQNPQSIFVEKTVRLDLMEMFESIAISKEEKAARIADTVKLLELDDLLDMHPYDLSGGEQQRAALAKVMLLDPEIIFLDEPTKGLDSSFKYKLAEILKSLIRRGKTIVMVSHDVEFCGQHADRCAMFFDGKIVTENTPRAFFSGNSFYTTAANRMSRHIFENAVSVDDITDLIKMNLDDGYDSSPPSGNDNEKGPDTGESKNTSDSDGDDVPESNRRIPRGVVDAGALILEAATILAGFYIFENKQYFIVSFMIVIYAMVPFFVSFERRKPKAREIVILAVMVSLAVVGRAAFFMVPNFKPILAIIIISGVALGKESGFLIGAMSAFVSNFLFGQGPWTPWQMIAMAVIGYLAGLIFHRCSGDLRKLPLMIFGGLAVFFIYGGIVDVWTILVMTAKPTLETVIMVYSAAIGFNVVHAAATMIFIFLLAKPVTGKLERVKTKYGMEVYSS